VSFTRPAAGEADPSGSEVVEGEPLTEKQASALRDELAELEGPRRTEVIAAIKKAREFGDLSENFEYHAAKNEQGLLEARIRTLRARLDGAQIVEDAGAGEVGVGSVVDIAGDGGQSMTVEISAVGGAGTVSPTSPLGSALLGKKLGDSVDVQAPKGAWKATIKLIH
jgi:transcription elongation factor GreA